MAFFQNNNLSLGQRRTWNLIYSLQNPAFVSWTASGTASKQKDSSQRHRQRQMELLQSRIMTPNTEINLREHYHDSKKGLNSSNRFDSRASRKTTVIKKRQPKASFNSPSCNHNFSLPVRTWMANLDEIIELENKKFRAITSGFGGHSLASGNSYSTFMQGARKTLMARKSWNHPANEQAQAIGLKQSHGR